MPGPLRSLVYVHTALRNELNDLAHLAHAVASSENDIEVLKERFDWATYALHYHAAGEDAALFPAIEAKHPGVAMTFDDDHQTDDALVAEMKQLLEATNAQDSNWQVRRLVQHCNCGGGGCIHLTDAARHNVYAQCPNVPSHAPKVCKWHHLER